MRPRTSMTGPSVDFPAVVATGVMRWRASAVPWAVRGLWVTLPFAAGPALAGALDGASGPVRALASGGLWAGWAAGVVASFIRHPVALTALRTLAPAAVVSAVAAAAGGHPSPLAVAWTAVTAAWSFAPGVGFRWVNGPAYGDERRFPLRAPGAMVYGALAVVWAVGLVAVTSGPLLLAARQWVWGALASGLGVPLGFLLLKSMHNLSRRWAVFVPAGLVLHDPLTLLDPVLFPRRSLVFIGPARRERAADLVDLTMGAPGLALEVVLSEAARLVLLRPGRREGESRRAAAVVFTPTRPGAVMEEARARRLPVR